MRRSLARREAILSAVASGRADVEVLAARFGVSASTIRRDLQTLSDRRAITRTYGGAVPAHPEAEESLDARIRQHSAAKAAIARAAAALIGPGDALILDGGSTVAALAPWLRDGRHRVITNNLPLITTLAQAPEIELVLLGGAVRPISMSTSGPLAEQGLRWMTADKALMGADGVIAGRGLCEATLQQVALKLLMMEQAAEVFVLADASKLGRASQSHWARPARGYTLVTDAASTEAQLAPFRAGGIRVILAE
jgi:DeoR/GlpR family transcriptional regulator of sugar metabolism